MGSYTIYRCNTVTERYFVSYVCSCVSVWVLCENYLKKKKQPVVVSDVK